MNRIFPLLIILMCGTLLAEELQGIDQDLSPTTARATTQSTTRPAPRRAAKRNPPNVIDKLVQLDTVDAFSDGSLHNATIRNEDPPRIELGYKENQFPRIGTWTSEEVRCDFPITNLIASFNVKTPGQTGALLEVRVEQEGKWSPWVYMQSWGKNIIPLDHPLKWDDGSVQIDEMFLTKPATKFQTRVTLSSLDFDPKVTPALRRVSVCYTGIVEDPDLRQRISPTTAPTNWARDLPVPFRGQGAMENPKSIRGMICSPTSTSMVLHYYGIDRPTAENAAAIFDPHHDLFGNWGRAVSRAGEFGIDAWLARFRNWDQVKTEIAQGHPVIASIRFGPGEALGLLYKSTGGHLIVIRGFKTNGDVIVNDPASRDKGNGVVYPAAELARAWFDNGGVGYVVHGSAPANVAATTQPTTKPAGTAEVR
ncbi:MAG TPA: C39 family peptidase [Tepidisphaeraceae bacterium]|jgi:hypothetical protein